MERSYEDRHKEQGLFSLKKIQRDLIAAFRCLEWVYEHKGNQHFTWVDSDITRENGFKPKERKFKLDVGGIFLLREWWGAATGCQGRLWIPHSWRYLRPGWMGPWAIWSNTWSSGWQPCLQQGGWKSVNFEVPSNPSHFMILGGTEGHGFVGVVEMSWWLDWMILQVFSHLNDFKQSQTVYFGTYTMMQSWMLCN